MNSKVNTQFRDLQQRWGKELTEHGDILSDIHLDFFQELVHAIIQDRYPVGDENFYIQENAGFYRFRILEVFDSQGNRYQVNYHIFSESQTHIHSHGYDGQSWIVDGELEYYNFQPILLPSYLVRLFEFASSMYSSEQMYIIQGELQDILVGKDISPSFITQSFAAYLGGGGAFSDVDSQDFHQKLLDDGKDFGIFASPYDVAGVLQNAENIYRLKLLDNREVGIGGKYNFLRNHAHGVRVENAASTLFITKKSHKPAPHEGEFLQFPALQQNSNTKNILTEGIAVREEMLNALKKLKI